jgi:hypothetical protein
MAISTIDSNGLANPLSSTTLTSPTLTTPTITSPTITSPTISGTYTAGTSLISAGTAVNAATGSPTSIDFTVPTWAKRITVLLSGISTVSTSPLLVQLGVSAGTVESSGYNSTATGFTGAGGSTTSATAGFVIAYDTASYTVSGQLVISNITSTSWVAAGIGKLSTAASWSAGGDKTMASSVVNVRFTTIAGNQAFDAGTVNILYE